VGRGVGSLCRRFQAIPKCLYMFDLYSEGVGSLYLHVPFCARKCSYCAFYSESSNGDVVNTYVESLIRELEMMAADLRPQTVFFGGGTPTLLNLRQWERVFRAMQRLNLLGAAEVTVECNPATLSLDKARCLRSWGVNRVSMGVQSLDETMLERLGRVHDRQMVFKSFDVLRQAGFDNLNLDLMFAIPGQTLETWRQTLDEALAFGSEHLSCYEVIYEEDTPLFEQMQAGQFVVDEDLACVMYEELLESAATAGFQQYEVANFARNRRRELADPSILSPRPFSIAPAPQDQSSEAADPVPNLACRHNLNYWRGGSFYGLGPSATSYVRGVRTKNFANTQIYCEQLQQGRRPIESSEELPPMARAGETAAFGLRMVAGWPFEQFRQTTGQDLREEWAQDMQQLVERDWGRIEPERFLLTSLGLRFADAAAELFLR
jgi:oxygen-independent coproporphyrinogen-3 oxidase